MQPTECHTGNCAVLDTMRRAKIPRMMGCSGATTAQMPISACRARRAVSNGVWLTMMRNSTINWHLRARARVMMSMVMAGGQACGILNSKASKIVFSSSFTSRLQTLTPGASVGIGLPGCMELGKFRRGSLAVSFAGQLWSCVKVVRVLRTTVRARMTVARSLSSDRAMALPPLATNGVQHDSSRRRAIAAPVSC